MGGDELEKMTAPGQGHNLYIRANLGGRDGWMCAREEEVVKSCSDNWVNNHLQREHGELGTWSQRATKDIHQQELSLGRTPVAQRWLDWISADNPVPVTHPGLLETQSGKLEISMSHGWDSALKMLPGNKVAAKPWLDHLLGASLGCKKAPQRLQPSPVSISRMQ